MIALICWISLIWRNDQIIREFKTFHLKNLPECRLEIHLCPICKKQFQVDRTLSIVLVRIHKKRTITKLPTVNKLKGITVRQKERDPLHLHPVRRPWINHFKKWSRR